MLLPERLLKTNRFPGFSAPTMNRFAVFGDVEKSSILGYLLQTLRDPHIMGCTSKSQNAHSSPSGTRKSWDRARQFPHSVRILSSGQINGRIYIFEIHQLKRPRTVNSEKLHCEHWGEIGARISRPFRTTHKNRCVGRRPSGKAYAPKSGRSSDARRGEQPT